MSILNFRKQRQYTKNKSGQYDLVSNWTSAETVYDRDGHCVMERLDNALLPMVDGTDNGKLLTVKNGGWAKGMVIPEADNGDDGKLLIADDGEWTKSQNAIIDQSKNAYTFGSRYNKSTVGYYSVVEGNNNTASGDYSHAEGLNTSASGDVGAHAEGFMTIASGKPSHAEGNRTTASGGYSHAEGFMTIASGTSSHAEGDRTTASGGYSHAEGDRTTASGNSSHAEGTNTTASGYCSHAEGYRTEANHRSQHVFGEYNIEDDSTEESYNPGNYVEIVGNGTGNNARSNARTLDWDGNEILAGKLTTTDVIKTSTWDGTNTSLKTTITNLRPIVVQKTVTTDSNLRVHCSIDPSDIDSSWTDFTHVTLCSLSLMNKANNKTYYAMGDSNHSNPYFEYQQSSMDLSYDVLSLGGSAGQEYLFTFVFLPIDNARVISLDT